MKALWYWSKMLTALSTSGDKLYFSSLDVLQCHEIVSTNSHELYITYEETMTRSFELLRDVKQLVGCVHLRAKC